MKIRKDKVGRGEEISGRPTVMIFGMRGMAGIQGGVEAHVTQLVKHLPIPACQIEVVCRKPYKQESSSDDPSGVRICWLPTIRHPVLEALVHSLFAVIYAIIRRPALLHIHGIGPNLVTPIARFMGLRVVATHHGNDYDREKWGNFARAILRFGERNAVLRANFVISISPIVAQDLRNRYKRDVEYIPNGVAIKPAVPPGDVLSKYGLRSGRYIVCVARIVPEKRQMDLFEAFLTANLPKDIHLVLIGGADHDSDYFQQLCARAAANPRVVMAGHKNGKTLSELFSNAGLFVLPSTHEGLPIALLEAMAYGLPILLSDLPVYSAMGLPSTCFFPAGDVAVLSRQLATYFVEPRRPIDWGPLLAFYDWNRIGRETANVYNRILMGCA